jgi:hypothetical protein
LSDAHFSGLSEYASPIISTSFLVEKNAKILEKAQRFLVSKKGLFYLI